MNRLLLSGTAFVAALTLSASAFALTPFTPLPLGGPYVPETAPAPPSTIYAPLPYYSYGSYYGRRPYNYYGQGYYPYYRGGY